MLCKSVQQHFPVSKFYSTLCVFSSAFIPFKNQISHSFINQYQLLEGSTALARLQSALSLSGGSAEYTYIYMYISLIQLSPGP